MSGIRLRQLRYHLRRQWRDRSRIVDRVIAASLAAFVAGILFTCPLGERLESVLLRTWFSLRGARPLSESVAIIQVDSRTKQALGIPDRDSIPRSVIADAVNKLMRCNPKAIIFDAVFEGEGPSPEADRDLALAFSRSPSVIGRSSLQEIEGRNPDGSPRIGRRKTDSHPMFISSAKYVVPFHLVLSNNVAEKIALSGDPTLENIPLLLPLRNLVDPNIEEPKEYDLINYYGESFMIPGIPLFRLLAADGCFAENLLQGRVIFVGWTEGSINSLTPDKRDSFLTPASLRPMYGVEIQATIAANLLDRSWIRRLPPHLELLLVFTLTIVISFMAASLPWKKFVPLITFAAVLWLFASYLAFVRIYYFLPAGTVFILVMPVFSLLLVMAESWAEGKKRHDLEAAIGLGSDG
ncbi:MAG TPA: CHASE2 domain-containing protein [Oligoflexia bacterium]|nr:CHASE2 domain-containing protein [Oligoflexia bacterium]